MTIRSTHGALLGACLGAVLAIAAISAPASAQPALSKQFLAAYEAGQDAFNLGQYDEARQQFERARDFEPDLPGPYRFLALVAQAQERWQDCLDAARAAIDKKPDSPRVPEVSAVHAGCRASDGRAPFVGEFGTGGAVAVTTNAAGASVRLNGLKYGAAPLAPRAFAVGALEVSVAAKGSLNGTVQAKVLAGLVTDVHVELSPDPAAAKETAASPVETAEEIDVGWLTLSTPGVAERAISLDGAPAHLR